MGTILSVLQKGKSIISKPRKTDLGEAKNNHQIATSIKLAALNYVKVANDEDLLFFLIKQCLHEKLNLRPSTGPFASTRLLNSLKDFINHN